MLAAAQFDSFSQALCLNAGAMKGLSDPGSLIFAMSQPDAAAVKQSTFEVRDLDAVEQLTGVLLLSSAWHEKRHFCDLLLTCYGAYRTRLNFQVMFAAPAVGREARSLGRLVVPITAYADEIRLQSLGVEPPYPPETCRLGTNLAQRYAFHEIDRVKLAPGLTLGATSCLEALAYNSQVAAIEYYFGAEASIQVQRLLQQGGISKVYTWTGRFGRQLGLVQDMGPGWPADAVKIHLAAPLMFMALCGRAPNLRGEGGSKGGSLAAERLPRLVQAMVDRKVSLAGMDGAEAWEALDNLHLAEWGCRCVDEIEADLRRDDELLRHMTTMESEGTRCQAFAEFAALRRRMVEEFRRDPALFVDPYVFPMKLLPRLQPRPLLQHPEGQFFPVPDGWSAICDGALPQRLIEREDVDVTPFSKWWWSITPDEWSVPQDSFGLQHPAWKEVMQAWAPVAKFLINGRAADDCIGPELQIAERTVADGCELLLETHAAQGAKPDPASYWFALGRTMTKCDLSGENIDAANAVFISPWRIHMSEHNRDVVLKRYGNTNPLAPSMLLKDWSVWVVHRRFESDFET